MAKDLTSGALYVMEPQIGQEIGMSHKEGADLSRPSKSVEDDMRARLNKSEVSYNRDDLRRDTYIPLPGSQGFPRAIRAANWRD